MKKESWDTMALTKKLVKTDGEVKALHPLIEEIWGEVFTPIIGEEQVAYMLSTYQSAENIEKEIADDAKYYLLMEGTASIGYTAYHLEPDALYISKLYLKATERGKGYSSSLFDWFEAIGREHKVKKLYLRVNKENERAIKVYEHKGFKVSHTKTEDIGHGFVMDDFFYEKEL